MKPLCSFRRSGFTLLELLVVISMIAVIASFTMPGLTTFLKAKQVSMGSQMLLSNLSLARQTALASNRKVEVRFYRYADPNLPGSGRAFRALQLFQYDEANQSTKPLGKLQRLPGTLVMDENATYSTLIADASRNKIWSSAGDPRLALPGIGNHYDACYFCFRPDGSTDLSRLGAWFLTVHGETDTWPAPAKNYATLQVDPINGIAKIHRPD
jgi:uncharacterized protein (TIGR02596 family)